MRQVSGERDNVRVAWIGWVACVHVIVRGNLLYECWGCRYQKGCVVEGDRIILQVEDFRCASICDESLANVKECLRDWSNIRVEENRDEVVRWFRLIRQKLVVIDLGLSMHMAGLWSEASLDDVISTTQASSYEELGQLASTVGSKPDEVVKRHLAEGQFLTLLQGVQAFVDQSPASLQASLVQEAAVVKEVLVRHLRIRSAMADIAEHLGVIACGYMPPGAAEAVQEYLTSTSKGASAQSFLLRRLALLSRVARLRQLGCFDWEHLGGMKQVRLCRGDQSSALGGDGEPIEFVDELRSDLVGWSVFSCLERLLQEALATALAQFVQGLHLEAIRVPSGPTLDNLLDMDAMQASTECAIKMLGDGSSPSGLPSTCLHDIFWKLYDMFLDSDDWQFNAADLCVEGDSPFDVDKETLQSVLQVFRLVGDLVLALSIFSWFQKRVGSAFKGDSLRPEVFTAFGMADSAVGLLRVQLPAVLAAVATDGANLPWKAPVSGLGVWVGHAQVVVTDLKKDFLKALGDRVEQEAQALAKATPITDHYIGESLYMKALAKKHLIEWKGRDTHEADTVSLFRRLAGLAATHKALRLQETLEEVVFDQKVMAEGVFARAKKVVAMAAFATCVQSLSGDEQKQTGKVLLEGGHDVPKALIDALRKVVK